MEAYPGRRIQGEKQETSLWLQVFKEDVLLNIAVDWLQDKNDHN